MISPKGNLVAISKLCLAKLRMRMKLSLQSPSLNHEQGARKAGRTGHAGCSGIREVVLGPMVLFPAHTLLVNTTLFSYACCISYCVILMIFDLCKTQWISFFPHFPSPLLSSLPSLALLNIKPRELYMSGMCSTTELHPRPTSYFL